MKPYPNIEQLEVAFIELRKMVDGTGYGKLLSDERVREASKTLAVKIMQAGNDPEEEGEKT